MYKVSDILPFFLFNLKDYYSQNEIKSFAYISIDHHLKMNKSQTILYSEKTLEDKIIDKIESIIYFLKEYKPIQYILKSTHFYGLNFFCDKGALIPRPETEELVNWIIQENINSKEMNYLDIGTGSACIIISLSKLLKGYFKGVDISNNALRIAKLNAKLSNSPADFYKMDILKENIEEKWDVIVSNPPYVLKSEIVKMRKNVLEWEPHLALFVEDNDPLLYYKRIANQSTISLNNGGTLYFEINENFGLDTVEMLKEKGFVNIELKKDINDKDRMVKATWK